jgi:hypothetical protein
MEFFGSKNLIKKAFVEVETRFLLREFDKFLKKV